MSWWPLSILQQYIHLPSMLVTPDWAFQPKSSKQQTSAMLLWQGGRAQPNKACFLNAASAFTIQTSVCLEISRDGWRRDIWSSIDYLWSAGIPGVKATIPAILHTYHNYCCLLEQELLLAVCTSVPACWGFPAGEGSWSKMPTQDACPTLPCSHFY